MNPIQKNKVLGVDAGFSKIFREQSTSELMKEVPSHEGQFSIWGRTKWGTEIRYAFRSYGQRSTYLSSWTLAGYQVHDLFIQQFVGAGVTLQFRAGNLLDENYQEELGYPSPGRQITFGFSWKHNSN